MAPSNLLQTNTASLAALFTNGRAYKIPLFQRQYSWGKEEWEDLWDDLRDLHTGHDRNHFMGAVVLQQETETSFLVIDGQQRFTTLTLLALAVIHTIENIASAGHDTEANQLRSEILRRLILGDKDPASLTHIGRLTLSRNDDGFFRDYILTFTRPPNLRRFPESNRRLLDSFTYFSQKIAATFGPQPSGEDLARFLNETVARRLQFIVITVEDDGNAYLLFETLNARGVSLSPADLIKNYLYSLAATSPADLERMDRAWLRLTGTTTQERFPEFLRFYLTCIVGRIRRERLFRTIREQVAGRPAAFQLLNALESSAELFAALREPDHEYWRANRDDRRRVRALQIFGVTQIFPVLFAAFEKFSRDDFSRVLKLAVILSFRYQIVGRLETSLLETLYADSARRSFSGELKSPAAVALSLARLYVPDDQFRGDMESLTLQTDGRDKRLVRYILFELEQDAANAPRDMDIDPATIEHILPENPGESWSDAFPAPQIEASIYRIGNLTLLESSLNRDAATQPFSAKRTLYAKSAYSLTNHIHFEDWTPETLSARQRQLAERALHIWRSDYDFS